MSSPEPEGKKQGVLRRIAGGSSSRMELYGALAVFFVLVVGGASGAAVVVSGNGGSSNGSTTTTSSVAARSGTTTTAVTAPAITTTSMPISQAHGSQLPAVPAQPQQGYQATWSAIMPDFVSCKTDFNCQVQTLGKIPAGWQGSTAGQIGQPGGMTMDEDRQCVQEGGAIETISTNPPPGAQLTQNQTITYNIICVHPATATPTP